MEDDFVRSTASVHHCNYPSTATNRRFVFLVIPAVHFVHAVALLAVLPGSVGGSVPPGYVVSAAVLVERNQPTRSRIHDVASERLNAPFDVFVESPERLGRQLGVLHRLEPMGFLLGRLGNSHDK